MEISQLGLQVMDQGFATLPNNLTSLSQIPAL